MTPVQRTYPVECEPARVLSELDQLMAGFSVHPLPGREWAELGADARWWIDWQVSKGAQWSRLGLWAQATDQPEAVCRAILSAEYHCATKALEFEARALRYEREATKQTKATRQAGGVR